MKDLTDIGTLREIVYQMAGVCGIDAAELDSMSIKDFQAHLESLKSATRKLDRIQRREREVEQRLAAKDATFATEQRLKAAGVSQEDIDALKRKG